MIGPTIAESWEWFWRPSSKRDDLVRLAWLRAEVIRLCADVQVAYKHLSTRRDFSFSPMLTPEQREDAEARIASTLRWEREALKSCLEQLTFARIIAALIESYYRLPVDDDFLGRVIIRRVATKWAPWWEAPEHDGFLLTRRLANGDLWVSPASPRSFP